MSDLKPQCVICARHPHGYDEPCTKDCRRVDAVEGLLVCRSVDGQRRTGCYDRMHEQLARIPELYALAGDEMLPGQSGGGRSTEVSLGLRVAALDLRAGGDVLERLAMHERDWREHFELDPVRTGNGRQQALDRYARGRDDAVEASLVGVCGFLLANLHLACQAHYAIDDFARELGQVHSVAQAAANIGQRPGWNVDCPADHGGGICGARLRITGEDYGSSVECPRCRTSWDVGRLLRVVASTRQADVWLPADDLALHIGINERTVRKWHAKGLVRRQGGRYSLDDVRKVIHDGGTREGLA